MKLFILMQCLSGDRVVSCYCKNLHKYPSKSSFIYDTKKQFFEIDSDLGRNIFSNRKNSIDCCF